MQGVFALKEEDIETIMINNNPETVSTDFTIADRLYFEPLILEDILNVIEAEGIEDVIVQLGGQTSLNLAAELENYGINLLGTNSKTIDALEDRELFYQLLDELEIPHIEGQVVFDEEKLYQAVQKIGYPILIRPSYVIGGKGMEIIRNHQDFEQYLKKDHPPYPVLVDKFLQAKEAEFDLVTDGEYICVPAIMEHIEKTGVHSGDSFAVLPPQNLTQAIQDKMIAYGKAIVQKLQYKGLMNIQFIVDGEEVYLLEINPRASRTVPIISKITGIQLVQIATKILLGKYKMSKDEYPISQENPFICVKYPVFSNYALNGLDSKVGPEMKSTGEGISLASSYDEALRKAFHPNIKKQAKKLILMTDEKVRNELASLAEKTGVELMIISESTSDWTEKEAIALFNPFEQVQDKKMRELAVKNRIFAFTEKETLEAFITALSVNEWTVNSIEEWHGKMAENMNGQILTLN